MISNMRDLGGTPAAGGKTVRPGMLVRSAALYEAEESDLAGISTVIDLRTPEERIKAPDRYWGREYLTLPVFERAEVGISHENGVSVPEVPDMGTLYGLLAKNCPDAFARILGAVISHDYTKGAVLWHCSEGKDRCGMTAALVLMLLGVSIDEIMKDDLKTNVVNVPKAEKIREKLTAEKGEEYASKVYGLYIADEKYLSAALEVFTPDYIAEMKLDPEAVEAFRRTVLE